MRATTWVIASIAVPALLLLSATAPAQTYVGDQTCQVCHANNPEAGFFDGYMNSGHPWKIFNTGGLTPPADTYPHTPLPPLPVADGVQLEWSDVDYIIGNFYWKARFIDDRGFIYTGQAGETTQWNLLTEEFVPYNAGVVDKPFDCGRCHTTGYDPAGNQDGKLGLIGTWAEDGVRCEACHGPSSEHAANPTGVAPPGGKACSDCHYRDSQFRMPWKGGFMRHHQQSEDLSHSAHAGALDCMSCHNPHRSVVYDDGGTTMTCSECHPGDEANSFYLIDGMESLDCIDCHMPFMGKSGQSFNEFTGDIRGHLFQIMTTATAAVDNVYDDGGSLFWNQDMNGDAFVTLDYACLGCHTDLGDGLTLQDAAAYAVDIHTNHPSPVELAWFDLAATGDQVSVRWRTSMESNHSGFDVLRAVDGADDYRQLNAERITTPIGPGRVYEFIDGDVEEGAVYAYQLRSIDLDGGTEIFPMGTVRVWGGMPAFASLYQNAPNPFNPSTEIRFDLPRTSHATLRIFDAKGRPVRTLIDETLAADSHTYTWDGRDETGGPMASGIYFYELETGGQKWTRKLVLMR